MSSLVETAGFLDGYLAYEAKPALDETLYLEGFNRGHKARELRNKIQQQCDQIRASIALGGIRQTKRF